MFQMNRPLCWAVGIACALLLATPSLAQTSSRASKKAKPGKVSQMEIFDGLKQSVRYFGENLSPSENNTLREIERLENESLYVRNLQELKAQYVASERFLEPHRRLVQRQLYGVDLSRFSYGTSYLNYPNYGAGYYGYPYVFSGNVGAAVAVAGESATESYSLANGVGSEGKIKEAMAMVLAQQSTPEYASSIDRAYDRVALRATTSPTLRAALNLPSTEDARKERDGTRLADAETGVTLTLKGGDKIHGREMSEKGDWFIINLLDGGQTRVRQSEVVRVDMAKTGKTVPAVDR